MGRPGGVAARVCVLNGGADLGKSCRFYVELMGDSPQIPVVFAGVKQRLSGGSTWRGQPGPSPRETTRKRLALTVQRAVETSWWWVIGSVETPVVIVDRDGRVVEANQATRRRFGENVIGRPYAQAIEGREGASTLPNGHPIRKAIGLEGASQNSHLSFRGVSRYIDVTSDGKVIRRAELLLPLDQPGAGDHVRRGHHLRPEPLRPDQRGVPRLRPVR